jgi:hypothetical protein
VSTLLNQARQDLVDDYYGELANLDDELFDGLITLAAYTYRHRQITGDIVIDKVTVNELMSARARRYPVAK